MSPTMDHASASTDMTSDQVHIAAKKRLESFTFRRMEPNVTSPLPSPLPSPPMHSHTRSHSRNSSIASVSFSNSTNSTLSFTSELSSSTSESRPSSGASARPSSHHRRRSSVSTRRDSAGLMGVTLPELPASSSENNVNFGDRDSVRRRALLALEGKVDLSSGSTTVEIPQLDMPDAVNKSFEFPVKSPSSISVSFGLINPLASRRDSFGKLLTPSSSMKDHLGTLMEEEEDDEGGEEARANASRVSEVDLCTTSGSTTPQKIEVSTPVKPNRGTPELSITTPSPAAPRHRPTNLVLRPLSLSPSPAVDLPTPSLTPSPRPNALRNLTLSSVADKSPLATPPSLGRRQNSTVALPSPSPSPSPVDGLSSRRSARSISTSMVPLSNITGMQNKRQSSISYYRSLSPEVHLQGNESLPTPGPTPTSEKRSSSLSSVEDPESWVGKERPLSPDEQSFLYHSQPVLLGRISELERALRTRSGSRPSSMQSDISAAPSELSDEMLQLVADLKTERDDLMHDVEHWKQRLDDLEKSKAVVERRIEAERREAWLKGEKLGLLEVENRTYIRQLEQKEAESRALRAKNLDLSKQLEKKSAALNAAQLELEELSRKLTKSTNLETELASAQSALLAERKRCQDLQSQLEAAELLQTPTPVTSAKPLIVKSRDNALGFCSTDSWGSATDVGSLDVRRNTGFSFSLKAVQEEPEDDREMDNELAHYEDEDDLLDHVDVASVSSSYESDDDDRFPSRPAVMAPIPAVLNTPAVNGSALPSPAPSPVSTASIPPPAGVQPQAHNRYGSLSRAWTFPRGERGPSPTRQPEAVDHFFECLDDLDTSPPPMPSDGNFSDKSVFSRALQLTANDEDEHTPLFMIASQPKQKGSLEVVLEEDEELAHEIPSVPAPDNRKLAAVTAKPDNKSLANPDVHLSPIVPFSFPSTRPNPFVTPTKPSTVSKLPSRIPPPSPPKFSVAPGQRKFSSPLPAQTKPTTVVAPSAAPRPLLTAAKATVVQGKAGPRSKSNFNAAVTNETLPSDTCRSALSPPNNVNSGSISNQAGEVASKSSTFSTRLSLQTFTNFMPALTWSARNLVSGGDSGNSKDQTAHVGTNEKKVRNYVSKELQLEKLRARMATEHLPHETGPKSDALFDACNRCVGGLMNL